MSKWQHFGCSVEAGEIYFNGIKIPLWKTTLMLPEPEQMYNGDTLSVGIDGDSFIVMVKDKKYKFKPENKND